MLFAHAHVRQSGPDSGLKTAFLVSIRARFPTVETDAVERRKIGHVGVFSSGTSSTNPEHPTLHQDNKREHSGKTDLKAMLAEAQASLPFTQNHYHLPDYF